MADNSKKLSELSTAANVAATDKVLVLYQAATGAPSTRTITVANLFLFSATLTANNTSFVGTVSAANVVSNNQLSSNLANYQTTAGLSANIAAYLPTYTGIVNGASHTVGSNFIANSTVLTFTPNTFNLGSVSKTANGYVWLPNGVLCQWGTVLANTTTGNTTFPIAFPTACQSVNFSVIGSANVAYQSAAPNTTVATIRTSSTTTAISVQYKAIGY